MLNKMNLLFGSRRKSKLLCVKVRKTIKSDVYILRNTDVCLFSFFVFPSSLCDETTTDDVVVVVVVVVLGVTFIFNIFLLFGFASRFCFLF